MTADPPAGKSSGPPGDDLAGPPDETPAPSRDELLMENPNLTEEQRRSVEARHSPSGPSARIVSPPCLIDPSHVAPARIRVPFPEADAVVTGDSHGFYGAGIVMAETAREWGYTIVRVVETEIDNQADEYLFYVEVMGRV